MPNPALQIITSSRPNRSTPRDERRHVRLARDVGDDRQHLAAGSPDLVRSAFEPIGAPRADHERRAVPASRRAVARPMPADAPVMATTLRTDGGMRLGETDERFDVTQRMLRAGNMTNASEGPRPGRLPRLASAPSGCDGPGAFMLATKAEIVWL